jgi:Ulp1 family protease
MQPRHKNFGIYYYDSVAYPPPREVASFMKQIEKEAYSVFSKKIADKFAMRYNKIQKQFSNYDCGVFSEVFLTQILKDIKFDDIARRMHTDDEINKLRDVLYTPSKME